MNFPGILTRYQGRCSSLLPRSLSHSTRLWVIASRNYVTHRDSINLDTGSSTLAQSLNGKQTRSSPSHDSVGPFQLGLSQSALRNGEKVKKWSELSSTGKVMRSTARTTNFTVILLGAGLSALLVYSLTTELFSKNSPTVLYGDACERIKSSPRVFKYLNGPLNFHNNPPSAIRPRHRNRHVTSQIMVDAQGHEHMIMSFYVQGKPAGYQPPADSSFDSAGNWLHDKLTGITDVTLDGAVTWSRECASDVWLQGKRVFKYLSGSPLPTKSLPELPFPEEKESRPKDNRGAWSFAGMFSSIRGAKGGPVEPAPKPDGRTYTDGEVHADLIKNNDGYFVFRYLLIDIPNSREHSPVRVFVERAPGVRENEPVMRWHS